MCGRQNPNMRDFFTNMKARMPLNRKIALLMRNNAIKIIKRQNCCGHPDEPGC